MKPTSNLPVQRRGDLRSMLEGMRPALEKELQKLDVERFVSLALKSVEKNPDLLKCDPLTVVAAVRDAAAVELEIDGVLGHAYIVPYKGKAQLQIGYKGLIKLAIQGGMVNTIRSAVVYEGDEFQMDIGSGVLKHTPVAPSKRKLDEGGHWVPIGAYAVPVWKDPNAPPDFEWMWIEEIEAIQQRSPAGKSGPWITDWEQMARKCPIRRLCGKRLNLGTTAARAVEKDEQVDLGIVEVEGTSKPATPPVDALDALVASEAPQPAAEAPRAASEPAGALDGEPVVRTVYGITVDIQPFETWQDEVCNAPSPGLKGHTWRAISEREGDDGENVRSLLKTYVAMAVRAESEGKPISVGWQRSALTLEAMDSKVGF